MLVKCLFLLFIAAGLRLALAQTTARVGDTQRYLFELSAPDETAVVLYRHLEIVRRQYDDDIDKEQLIVLADRAQRQARELLATEGYFNAVVEVNLDDAAPLPRVRMNVQPGIPARVTRVDIQWTGVARDVAQAFYERHALRDQWRLNPGDIFRQEAWDASKNTLVRAFRLDQFPLIRIVFSEAQVDAERGTVQLRVDLDSGAALHFGELRWQGLQRYPATVLTSINTLTPGTPYSQNKIAEFQAHLLALPYFSSVTVQPLLDQVRDGQVPVLVDVEELQRRKILMGVGVSSNTGARVQFGYSDFNVRERGWRLDTLLKWEQRQQSLEAQLGWPRRSDGWQDTARAAWLRSDIEGLRTRSHEIDLRREKDDGRQVRAVTLKMAYAIEEPQGGTRRISRALAPGYDWTRRQVDHLIYPRSGYVLNLQAAFGTKALLSDQNFVRAYGKWQHYWPVGDERDSLQWRLEAGMVWARSRVGVPQEFLFRAGGDQSIRGYDYQSIGVQEALAVVGGRYLAIAGLEYTHWWNAQWGLGVFAEAGDAFDEQARFQPAWGIGLGPRWRSPVGPVNIDVAYGERERQWRLHFSLGVAF